MTTLIKSADIAKHAEQAARDGKGPEACPFIKGTHEADYWRDVFYVAASQVIKIREAA
ncbi:MAG TPA: hypothetical protein VN081_06785 [Dongiaceae bacterium]|nr:hypothetical protein [Dongiaceae bacterium]